MGAATERRADGFDKGNLHFLVLKKFIFHGIRLQYVQSNKALDSDWFRLESNKEGTKWFGKCWYMHNLLKYEFDVEFDVSEISLLKSTVTFLASNRFL